MWTTDEARNRDAVRFYGRVPMNLLSDNCWEWQGAVTSTTGYGKVKVQGKALDTHRVSWMLSYGPIPVGMFVCHRCDNRRCVRPQHLFLGTHTDNIRDAQAKGRLFRPDNTGENSPRASMTWETVREIRARHAAGARVTDLGQEFGVDRRNVSKVVHGQTWKELA